MVESGEYIIYLTRNGKPVAALIDVHFADELLANQGEDAPVVPGDVAGAIKLVEYLLGDGSENRPNPEAINSVRRELVGGFMTLVDIMLSGAALNFGVIPVTQDDGSVENKYVADFLARRLYTRSHIGDVALSVIPTLVGCLWAAQVGDSAVNFRRMVLNAVTPREAIAWLFALEELCRLINAIHGDGSAEEIMYSIEEGFRDGSFDLRPEPTDDSST